jgi:carboxyl-terminal processing protease
MFLAHLFLGLRTCLLTLSFLFAFWARLENAVAEEEIAEVLADAQLNEREVRPAAKMLVPAKATDFNQVISNVAHLLQTQHYLKLDMDAARCTDLLERYFEALDPERIFLHEALLSKLRERFTAELPVAIFENGMSVATEIFLIHREQVRLRTLQIQTTLAKGTPEVRPGEMVELDRQKLPFPTDPAMLDEIWRKRLANDILNERLYEVRHPRKARAAGDSKEVAVEKSAEQKVAEFYQKHYKKVEQYGEENVAAYFLSAMCRAYDPHSDYLGLQEKEKFDNDMKKKLVGIGVRFAKNEAQAIIENILPESPARRDGRLQEGDRVVGLGQGASGPIENVETLSTEQVADKIRGEEGTEIRLEVRGSKPTGESRIVRLKRSTVDLKENRARAELIELPHSEGGTKLGWVSVDNFYGDPEKHSLSLTSDVELLVKRLMSEGMQGLVIDLRDNPGGYLEEAVALAGLFLPRGPVVMEQDNKGQRLPKSSTQIEPLYKGPLTVLTDGGSASASEIFAALVQDRGRAVVVGEGPTFGKGTVQAVLNLRNLLEHKGIDGRELGTLKITIRKFYRIAGGSTQQRGVSPDITLPPSNLNFLSGERTLARALSYDSVLPMKHEKAVLPLEELLQNSKQRVAANGEMKSQQMALQTSAEARKSNQIPLDANIRLEIQSRLMADLEKRRASRRLRFEQAESAHQLPKVTPITMQTVNQPVIAAKPAVFPELRVKSGNHVPIETAEDFPLGLEPNKVETLRIAQDLVRLTLLAKTEESPATASRAAASVGLSN